MKDSIPRVDELAEDVKHWGWKFKKETLLAIAAAITVVAALGWNEAMKSLFATLFSSGTTLVMQFGYAIFITVVVVIFGKLAQKDAAPKDGGG